MSFILFFSTSPLITPDSKLIRELQANCPGTNFYAARKDASEQPPTKFGFIDDVSVSQLKRCLRERCASPDREPGSSASAGVFGILDEQSTQDNTIVIHNEKTVFDDRTEEKVGGRWVSWRIRFSGVNDLLTPFLIKRFEVIEEVLLKPAAYTGEDGVFDVERAVKDWLQSSGKKEQREAFTKRMDDAEAGAAVDRVRL